MKKKKISFKDVSKYHTNMIKNVEIPEWIIKQKCSQCNKKIGHLSLRSVGLRLNAQHIGNFFVEICCKHCNYGYELHLKSSCKNIDDLIFLLKNNISKKMEPDYLIPNSESNLTQAIIKGEACQ